ncbi:MAG: transketolase C-terminal domain-containing protein [Gemmatimonadaceae bacterium]
MRDAFVSRLESLAAADPRIFLVTGDLGFAVLDRYRERFPKQFLNAGVAEQNMTGVATGLALDGRIVFTYSIANFPTLRCLEQIRNDASYHEANVKVVAIGGGFSYGALGMSHHATEDLAIFRAMPGVTVVAPGCLWEVEGAVDALVASPGTAYLRLDKSSAGRTGRYGERFVLGDARVLREGEAVTIIAAGGILAVALAAADALAADGVHCRVVSMHTLSPFDDAAVVRAARETGGIVTLEEHVVEGGLSGAVAEACLDAGVMPARFRRIGLRGGFASRVGSQDYLRAAYGMDAPATIRAVRELLGGGGPPAQTHVSPRAPRLALG